MVNFFERSPIEASSDAWDELAGTLVVGEYFDTAPPAATGLVKVFTAAGWAARAVKVWTGSAWRQSPLRRWTGASWV